MYTVIKNLLISRETPASKYAPTKKDKRAKMKKRIEVLKSIAPSPIKAFFSQELERNSKSSANGISNHPPMRVRA